NGILAEAQFEVEQCQGHWIYVGAVAGHLRTACVGQISSGILVVGGAKLRPQRRSGAVESKLRQICCLFGADCFAIDLGDPLILAEDKGLVFADRTAKRCAELVLLQLWPRLPVELQKKS